MLADFIPWGSLPLNSRSREVLKGTRKHHGRRRELFLGMLGDRAAGCAIPPKCLIRAESFEGCSIGWTLCRSRCPRPRSCLLQRASPAALGLVLPSCDGL